MAHLREVADGVLVGTSRFMVTNTVVVAAGRRALVVDPGVHVDELEAIAVDLVRARLELEAGFATHAHWDHVLWHDALGDVPRWATPGTVQEAATRRVELAEEAEAVTPIDLERFGILRPVGDAVPWTGPAAVVVTHDAHAPAHAALHLPELGLLVAGDLGSDVEVPLLTHGVPGPEALLAHHTGLDRLAALSPVDLVVPGHGHPCDGAMWRRRLDADRRYLDALAAGDDPDDPRVVEPWLVEAERAMQATLTKAAWRRWARHLPPPAGIAHVQAGLRTFLGPAPGLVGAYEALPGEVDLTGALIDLDATVALARIDGDTVSWHVDDGTGEVHPHGMRQPLADAPVVAPAEIDVLLVPGRLFDRRGIRLGRGGGHYDRLLPHLRPGVPAIGVTVEERVVPRLPTERHDAPMTHLATRAGVSPVA